MKRELTLFICLGLVATFTALAQMTEDDFLGSGPALLPGPVDDLDLGGSQEAQVKEIIKANKPGLDAAMLDLLKARKALSAAIELDQRNSVTVQTRATAVGQSLAHFLETLILETLNKVKTEVSTVLTAEQRHQAAEHKAAADRRIEKLIQRLSAKS
jgi:Spy/CpxP family protein refolding chaperone